LPAGDVPVRSLHHGSRSPLMSGLTYRLSVCFYRPTVSLLRLQPSTGKASTMQLAELDAHRRAVQTRSGEISYIDTGTGPVALFAPGTGPNSYLWRNVIEAVRHGRRCVALDLPLHGQTPVTAGQDLSLAAMASVLEDFCDALGLAGI